ncbi:MAG: hypothetical protein ACI81G_001171, partial [Gammaproteobacteria bacterium]
HFSAFGVLFSCIASNREDRYSFFFYLVLLE